MKYLRIINNQIVYPYNLISLKREYKNVSFPDLLDSIDLSVYDVHVVNEIPMPSNENYTKLISEGIPELVNGEYYQKWLVTDASPEYTDQVLKSNAVKEYQRNKETTIFDLRYEEIYNKASTATTDEEIEKYKNLYPLWEDQTDGFTFSVDYKVNYIDSTYNVRLFKCIQSHAKQSDWTPAATPALWSEIIIGSGGIEVWIQPIGGDGKYPYIDPLTGNPYQVTHNGLTWVNNVPAPTLNVWEPGVYGWTQI